MPLPKYLYLDDDPDIKVLPIIDLLKKSGKIVIDRGFVTANPTQVESLLTGKEFDGLLVDFRLDQHAQPNGEKATYTATTLAQFLRSKVNHPESSLRDVPIVLCSQQPKFEVYNVDLTSHDLFDFRFRKDDLETKGDEIAEKLACLVEGYRTLGSHRGNWDKVLAYDTARLNKMVFGQFARLDGQPHLAIHEHAHFILKELLQTTSDLISERILAARLGVSISCSGWPALKDEVFAEARYQGVFASSWPRWWQPSVDDIFEQLCHTSLASLEAAERVECLTEATAIKDISINPPIEHNSSANYWTICQALQEPLDPTEGYRLRRSPEPAFWQEYDYISLKALLDRMHITKLERPLHPVDNERYEIIRLRY